MKDIKLRVGQRWVEDLTTAVRVIKRIYDQHIVYDLYHTPDDNEPEDCSATKEQFLIRISNSKLDKRYIIREFFRE